MVKTPASITIINTVIQLHRFIPIIHSRTIVEMIITSSLGRHFMISIMFLIDKTKRQLLIRTVIKVILLVELSISSVILSQIFYSIRLAYRLIFSRHMIGDKVHNNFHACMMGARNQALPLLHTFFHVYGKVRIHIVIIGDSIRRARFSFHHFRMLTWYAVTLRIVRCGCMTNYTREPHVRDAQIAYLP